MTKTTRRGFLGALFCAAAWKSRPRSLGCKMYPLPRALTNPALWMLPRKDGQEWRPADYHGQWMWVLHERNQL